MRSSLSTSGNKGYTPHEGEHGMQNENSQGFKGFLYEDGQNKQVDYNSVTGYNNMGGEYTSVRSSTQPVSVPLEGNRYSGELRTFCPMDGYGFISCDILKAYYGRDTYVHKNEITPENIPRGAEVGFTLYLNRKGQPQARGVVNLSRMQDKGISWISQIERHNEQNAAMKALFLEHSMGMGQLESQYASAIYNLSNSNKSQLPGFDPLRQAPMAGMYNGQQDYSNHLGGYPMYSDPNGFPQNRQMDPNYQSNFGHLWGMKQNNNYPGYMNNNSPSAPVFDEQNPNQHAATAAAVYQLQALAAAKNAEFQNGAVRAEGNIKEERMPSSSEGSNGKMMNNGNNKNNRVNRYSNDQQAGNYAMNGQPGAQGFQNQANFPAIPNQGQNYVNGNTAAANAAYAQQMRLQLAQLSDSSLPDVVKHKHMVSILMQLQQYQSYTGGVENPSQGNPENDKYGQ